MVTWAKFSSLIGYCDWILTFLLLHSEWHPLVDIRKDIRL